MKPITRLWNERQWTERGQALVLFAGGLAVFLGLVGLSIDIGRVVATRTDLQKAADAAAFAGAVDLPDSTTATASATDYVALNSAGSASDIEVTSAGEPNDTIRVTASKHVTYNFLKFIGLDGTDVSASAKVRMRIVTGYNIDSQDIFPYTVWGGARTPGHTNSCPFNICVGSTQTFRSNNFEAASHAAGPDWQINGNNFKGYFHAGGDVTQIDPNTWQTFSKGGNALGQQPMDALYEHMASGEPIVLPVIKQANCSGGCGNIDFKIAAWVALEITFLGNPSQDWTGTVVEYHATPQGATDGDHQPPADFPVVRTATLTE